MRIRAEDLTDVDVPLPGGGAAVPGEGEGVAHHVRLQDHVVASVGAAQYRRLRTILARSELGSDALGCWSESSGCRGHCAGLRDLKLVKVESDLADAGG